MHQSWEETILNQYCGQFLHIIALSLTCLFILKEVWYLLLKECKCILVLSRLSLKLTLKSFLRSGELFNFFQTLLQSLFDII